MVVTRRSPTSIASIMQEQIGAPSEQTCAGGTRAAIAGYLRPGQTQRAAQRFGQN